LRNLATLFQRNVQKLILLSVSREERSKFLFDSEAAQSEEEEEEEDLEDPASSPKRKGALRIL